MKKFFRWVFYVVVALILIGFFVGKDENASSSGSTSQATSSNSAAQAEATSAPQKPVYETTARKLFNAYEENEVATDEALKGKRVAVTGIVQSIDKDFTNSIIISLKTDNQFMAARMEMKDSQKAAAMSLKKGNQVVIVCEKMSRIIGAPSGRDCTFN
ncbi:hypothetical protein [Pantoea sp. CCBC3-3-1]|uniref:OB-fold protein n=1 Tax=Pantoea sp. CCBC3-3-1 TaxID=2490851 RepID=UPI0011BE18FC|nr:hypothetical protein [Pantoea sp. CCBC3-3-1]